MFTKVKIMQDLSNKKLDTLSEDIGFLKLTIDILLLGIHLLVSFQKQFAGVFAR